ncbi:hypothetical protein C7460_13234 [Marinoscillum furvescens DSM 4134]|uniref:Uncharacterized protein n=2 Tax=Marinoscillum furvescens TaxID=1026 RepID=A0A3D9KY31_MARFU|nr:hypothetical protein C7460_13234 [Marinoscillum furvescens DSM 4134]
MGLTYSAQWYLVGPELAAVAAQTDDSKNYFHHTVPLEASRTIQVKNTPLPQPLDEPIAYTAQWAPSRFFTGHLQKQTYQELNLLIERKKVQLLYPFHFYI